MRVTIFSFYPYIAVNELVLSTESHIIEAACIECKTISFHSLMICINITCIIFKAPEAIHDFNDMSLFCNGIDPGSVYWRWTMTPIPKTRHGKGRRKRPIQYSIMVNPLIEHVKGGLFTFHSQ